MLEKGPTPERSTAGRVMPIKNDNNTIKKETREILDCGAVPDIVLGFHK